MDLKKQQQAYLKQRGFHKIVDMWEANLNRGITIHKRGGLVDAFHWDRTPEGSYFWDCIFHFLGGKSLPLEYNQFRKNQRWI